MTVQDVVDMAKFGELYNLGIADNTPAILSYLNLGMLELYKRFALNIKEYVIELQDGVEIYDMPEDYMWLITAYDEVPETSVDPVAVIPINVEDDPLSINTINWYQVQVPVVVTGSYISLIYNAAPSSITEADLGTNLALPSQLVEALLHYIGYRAHASMDGSIQAENSAHYQRFELSCDRAKENGVLTADDMDMSTRLKTRGFA